MDLKSSDSVADMVRQVTGDEACSSRLVTRSAGRALVNVLIAHRLKYDLSQDDVAKRLNRSQSKVSKFENADDADLRFGDILEYAKATGLLITLTLTSEKRKSAVEQIKHHAFRIKELLEQIVSLAGNDADMIDGAKHFLQLEVPLNLLSMVVEVAKKLPQVESKDDHSEVVIDDNTEECEDLTSAISSL